MRELPGPPVPFPKAVCQKSKLLQSWAQCLSWVPGQASLGVGGAQQSPGQVIQDQSLDLDQAVLGSSPAPAVTIWVSLSPVPVGGAGMGVVLPCLGRQEADKGPAPAAPRRGAHAGSI